MPLRLEMQSLWFGQLLLGHCRKGRELEIHSSPDDPPGNLPKRVIFRFENKHAHQGKKVSRSWFMTLLTSTSNSAAFLIKSQPGTIVWLAQKGLNHPPISHWITHHFYDIDGVLFNLELTTNASLLPVQAKLFLFVCCCCCLYVHVWLWVEENSRGGVYWIGFYSVWTIWRYQLSNWENGRASTLPLSLIAFEANKKRTRIFWVPSSLFSNKKWEIKSSAFK